MSYDKISVPQAGEKITVNPDCSLNVPDNPLIPFIEGDGIGIDVTPAMQKVVAAAIDKAYGSSRDIVWLEIYAGEKANSVYGEPIWLPEETLQAISDFVVAIKGPLTTPVGGGIRSLNATMRQTLDLYVCLRPIRYFDGVPSPVKHPEQTDMVIFRENSEGIYTGVEWAPGSEEAKKLIEILSNDFGVTKIAEPEHCGIGIKHTSEQASKRLVRRAIQYAIDNNRNSVSIVHKGNIMKFTEGAFMHWGYEVARDEFGAESLSNGTWHTLTNPNTGNQLVIKDVIADAFLQEILLRPSEYDVIATQNLNGDYISDALAAQVGGIGISPGANIGDNAALFEATHGTAPKFAGQNLVNPGSLILSAEMMLRHIGWCEAADLIVAGMQGAISAKTVTFDFASQMDNATQVSTSDFADAVINHMK